MEKSLNTKKIKNRKGNYDITILVATYFLVIFGLIMIFSASSIQAKLEHDSSIFFLKKQAFFVILGTVLLIFSSNYDYRKYKKYAFFIFGLNIVLLLATLTAGVTVNDARRWINIGFRFQTSEFSKFACIVMTSYIISKNKKLTSTLEGLIITIMPAVITFLLVLLQPSFSAGISILIPAFIMIFIAGMDMIHFLFSLITGLIGIFYLSISKGYRSQRIQTFLDPFKDMSGDGWQIANSLLAIASGGLWGVGFGKSTQKYFYISQPQNDFIFAVIAEELGFFKSLLLIFLFVYLVFRILNVFVYTKDIFGKMLVCGIGIQIGIQFIINLAVTTKTVPTTGMGLPFISYGGTSIIMFLFMIGVVLNVSKYREFPIKNKK